MPRNCYQLDTVSHLPLDGHHGCKLGYIFMIINIVYNLLK
jgi:hypothetical protein